MRTLSFSLLMTILLTIFTALTFAQEAAEPTEAPMVNYGIQIAWGTKANITESSWVDAEMLGNTYRAGVLSEMQHIPVWVVMANSPITMSVDYQLFNNNKTDVIATSTFKINAPESSWNIVRARVVATIEYNGQVYTAVSEPSYWIGIIRLDLLSIPFWK